MADHSTARGTPAGKAGSAAPLSKTSFLNDQRVRGVLYQILTIGAVVAIGWYLVHNTLTNLAARDIATGFGFLEREAGFDISESVIEYSPADTYGRVLLAGLLNTLKVSIIGIILATLIGTIIGIARLSNNWLVAKLASVYVEGLRNIPAAVAALLLVRHHRRRAAAPTPSVGANQRLVPLQPRFSFPLPSVGNGLDLRRHWFGLGRRHHLVAKQTRHPHTERNRSSAKRPVSGHRVVHRLAGDPVGHRWCTDGY